MPTSRTSKFLNWKTEHPSRAEKLCSILNCQLFIASAGVLVFQNSVMNRIGSWSTICVAEGFFIIFAILLMLKIDSKNKLVMNLWPLSIAILELCISLCIALEDTHLQVAVVSAFLLLASLSETASLKMSLVVLIFGIAVAATHDFSKSHLISLIISLVNIGITIFMRIYIQYSKVFSFVVPHTLTYSRNMSSNTFSKSHPDGPNFHISQVGNLSSRLVRFQSAESLLSQRSHVSSENQGNYSLTPATEKATEKGGEIDIVVNLLRMLINPMALWQGNME